MSTQRSEYSPGESVIVDVAVTNGDPAACSAFTAAEATLSVVDLTRDDQPVLPRESSASYIDGMTSYLRQRIVQIGPGQTVTLDYASPFTSSHLVEGDEADTSIWSVDQPGVYRLSLRFVPPTIPGGPANQCPAAAEPAGVSFTVRA